MVRLTLSAPLAVLLPGADRGRGSRTTVQIEASCWSELAGQLRERFPALASRVLTGASDVNPSFVVVVNDEVTRRPAPTFALTHGDEVFMFAAVAGGCA
jgi:molybdopterin converting factor small subunit